MKRDLHENTLCDYGDRIYILYMYMYMHNVHTHTGKERERIKNQRFHSHYRPQSHPWKLENNIELSSKLIISN